jgi:hypothetical protein
LEGGALGHPTLLLETAVLAGQDHPVLSLLSPRFLRQGVQTYEELRRAGYTELVVYMAQQIQQFQRLGKKFAMQHLGSEDELVQVMRDLLISMPQILQAVPAEERVEGLPPEERLKGLTPRELEHLRDLLQQQTRTDDDPNPK